MLRINNVSHKQIATVVADASSGLDCIWNGNISYDKEKQFDSKAIATSIKKSIEKQDINKLKICIKKTPPTQMANVLYEFRNLTGKSLLMYLKTSFPDNRDECKEIEKTLRTYPENSYVYNEILATDLLSTLNGKNPQKIETLLNKINSKNVNNVYAIYQSLSRNNDEIAATKEEKKILDDFWALMSKHRRVKRNAERPETLFQGILNNESLTLEQKRNFLNHISDKFVEYAKDNGYKTQKYEKIAGTHINDCTSKNSSVVMNAYWLEECLAEMMGFKQ